MLVKSHVRHGRHRIFPRSLRDQLASLRFAATLPVLPIHAGPVRVSNTDPALLKRDPCRQDTSTVQLATDAEVLALGWLAALGRLSGSVSEHKLMVC